MELATFKYYQEIDNLMEYLIIGDSHTLRLRNAFPNRNSIDCEFGPMDVPVTSKCIQNHKSETEDDYPIKIHFSGHRGKTAFRASYLENDNYPCLNKFRDPNVMVLPWFGYIDVKQFLPLEGFKNPEYAVNGYVEKMLSFFKDQEIRFIEPLPQFVNILGFGSPLLPFEDREPYQKAFLKNLREQCERRGLKKPISIEEILGTDKLEEHQECHTCINCLETQYSGFKLDHPNNEIFTQIAGGIVRELTQ
jgi:hypothetical protein